MYTTVASHTSQKSKILLLHELLDTIALQGYKFTAVTPLTHERFLSRSAGLAKNIRDIFGWNLPFEADLLSPLVLELMSRADLLTKTGDFFRSKIRIASLNEDVFIHSSFPTDDEQSVFFGPDTYRFSRFIKHSIKIFQLQSSLAMHRQPLRVLDAGCGSGAGGITAIRALMSQQTYELNLNDLNLTALEYATVCARVADIEAAIIPGDFFSVTDREFDLIISNPPYIIDPAGRLYRDGGSSLGLDLSMRMVKHAVQLLAPGGHMLLYTGVAMTSNEYNPLLAELIPNLAGDKFKWSYEEIDPDIFGEELEKHEYRDAHRIAAIGLTIMRIK